MKRKEIWKALGTADAIEARLLAPAALMEVHRLFDNEHKAAAAAQKRLPEFSVDQLREIARRYYDGELRTDELERQNGLPPGFAELVRTRSLEILKRDLGSGGTTHHVSHVADEIVASALGLPMVQSTLRWDKADLSVEERLARRHSEIDQAPTAHIEVGELFSKPDILDEPDAVDEQPPIDRGSPAYRELAQFLMRAKVEALTRIVERDGGDFTGKPSDPILLAETTRPAISPAPIVVTAATGETIQELHERYLSERQGISEEWRIVNRAVMRLFADYIGSNTAVSTITKRQIRAWKDALLKYPSRGSLRKDGGTFQDIIKTNEVEKKPTISVRTINKYLSVIAKFSDWMVENEYLEENPVTGVYLQEDDGDDKRDPFTIGQLKTLFNSPLFVGALSDNDGDVHKVGQTLINDYRYWLPLLGLWSGARLGELAQLTADDIQNLDGVMCFNINAIGNKRVKNRSARRVIPIHSELIRLGFLNFVERRRTDGIVQLFPEILPDSLGRISSEASKWYGRYLRKIKIKTGPRLTFHSLRHSFVDQMRLAGYSDMDTAVIVGHAKQTTTAGYGNRTQFGPKQRQVMIEAVRYEGLDLTHLYDANRDGLRVQAVGSKRPILRRRRISAPVDR